MSWQGISESHNRQCSLAGFTQAARFLTATGLKLSVTWLRGNPSRFSLTIFLKNFMFLLMTIISQQLKHLHEHQQFTAKKPRIYTCIENQSYVSYEP
jgi:hypothetical protein